MNWKLLIAILLPIVLGSMSSWLSTEGIRTWYATLNKPWFNPPSYLFGPVWTILYILMGWASWLVYKTISVFRKRALTLYLIQLGFNMIWTPIFFRYQQLTLSFIVIIILWLLINATIIYFNKVNKMAAYMLLPYVVWVSFASLLNFYLLILNP